MERSFPVARLLVAAVALIAAFGVGFTAATASADQGDPVDEMRRMHAEMHASHAEWAWPTTPPTWTGCTPRCPLGSPEDRARHEHMHEACSGLMTERSQE